MSVRSTLLTHPLFDSKIRGISGNTAAEKVFFFAYQWHWWQIDVFSKIIQNSKLNIAECIEGLNNLRKYLKKKNPQRSNDNFKKICRFGKTILATDLGIDPEFSISKLRVKST